MLRVRAPGGLVGQQVHVVEVPAARPPRADVRNEGPRVLRRVVPALEEEVSDADAPPGLEDSIVQDPEDLLQGELPVRWHELAPLIAEGRV